jgi:peptidoglycan/xylan/chitin deacetylase (PgdA/CDA1 family)
MAATVARDRPLGRSHWRRFLRKVLATVAPSWLFVVRGPEQGAVYLTFDDGPHPEHTPALLDVLKEQGARATFFVVGQEAERHPEIVRRMRSEGHLVGHHSWSHSDPGRTTARQLVDEVRRTRKLLAVLLGEASNLFRPPHGKLTVAKLLRLWRDRQTVVLWNTDTRDFACQSSDEFAAFFRRNPLRGGDVVLMHDNRPHAPARLAGVIAEARQRGLVFSALAH